MKIEITSVSARDSGALICVSVRLSSGENFEIRELLLLPSQYTELGVAEGEIGEERFDGLLAAADLCSAFRKGLSLLGYGACSKKELSRKLSQKGVARQLASGAAEMLERMGYINEREDSVRIAERCVRKYWGLRRIRAELYSKGYGDIATQSAVDSLDEIDFSELCAEYIVKKYKALPEAPEGRKKLFAALMRMGYSSSEIKEAFRVLLRER